MSSFRSNGYRIASHGEKEKYYEWLTADYSVASMNGVNC